LTLAPIGNAARPRLENPRRNVIDPAPGAGTSASRARQLRDAPQSCATQCAHISVIDRRHQAPSRCPSGVMSIAFTALDAENFVRLLTALSHINVPVTGARLPSPAKHCDRARVRVDWGVRQPLQSQAPRQVKGRNEPFGSLSFANLFPKLLTRTLKRSGRHLSKRPNKVCVPRRH